MTPRMPLLRVLLTAHLSLALILWLPLLVLSALIVTGIHVWGEVDRSIWHYLATQATRWFALSLGIDAVTTYLRLTLAHGRTRREFLTQLVPYLGGLAVCLAAMVTIGYQAERGAYALFGWDHRTANTTSFGDTGNILGLLGAYALVLGLWALAGVLVAAGFTRSFPVGVLTVPLGLLIVVPSETLVGLDGLPALERLAEAAEFPVLTAVVVSLGTALVGYAAIWRIVRDMPLRAKVA